MCFLRESKSDQAARCIKKRITTKVNDYIISIYTIEQKCVVLKFILQSPRLKDRVQTIGIYQSLSNNDIYEHKCLENIKILYKKSGKCDNQKQFKDILESAMISTPKGFTNSSPIYPMTSTPIKKPIPLKSLCLFTKNIDVKINWLPLSWSY